MFPRMSKDLALCIPAVAPGDPRDLSVGQQELLNAVQVTSHVPEIIALSRLSEGIALRELEGLLRGGWVIPLNPTLGGRHAIDPLPVSAGTTPSTVKGFVSPDELSAAHTQRTFNPVSTSRSEQEMEAALARLTDMTIKPGDTASVFASSVAPQTPQVNAGQTSVAEPSPARPPEARTSIKAVPIRTVAVGVQKPREPQVPAPIAPAQVAPAQVVTPKVPDAKRSSQPALDPAQVHPSQPAWLSATEKDQSARRSSNPPPRSDNPGEWRSPIPLPSDLANDRRSPLPRVTGDRRSPLPSNGTGERSSLLPGLTATGDRQSPLPQVSKAERPQLPSTSDANAPSLRAEVIVDPGQSNSLRASSESNDNFVFMLGPKSVPPMSPFPPAPSGEFSADEHELAGTYAPQERTVSDIESLRKGSSRPPPNVSEIQALNLPDELAKAVIGTAPGESPVGPPRSLSNDKGRREELVPGEPLPLVRVTRRASPALGIRSPDRVVTVGQRDAGNRPQGAQSPVPGAVPQQVVGPRVRMTGGTLVGGMQIVRDAETGLGGDAPPPLTELESVPPPPDTVAIGDSQSLPAEPAPVMHRESGRTLVGGSYAGANAGSGETAQQDSAQTAPAMPAPRIVGMSRMVVIGERGAAPAPSPATQTPLIASPGGKQTLLGVRAPDVEDLAGFALADQAANDTPEPESAAHPDNLDHFQVIECLARGGSGVVYRVRHPKAPPGEFLALKVLRQGIHRSKDAVDALTREATLMQVLSHPGLVQLDDFGYEGDEPFLLMEYVNGLSMSELLHHPVPLPLDVGLMIVQDALEVLDYVHSQSFPNEARSGIIHCDVSPQNLLVGIDGRTRLIDFGIARATGSPIGDSVVRCTPRYASPELLAGKEVDATNDVFAVGAVLFQVLSKVPAFSSDPDKRKRESLVPNPSKLNSRAPSRFDPICHRALAEEREHRFPTAREMLEQINSAVELSGILLRRERVQQWVQGVVQARQGEVLELSGDQVKEMLGEGRLRAEGSSPVAALKPDTDPPARDKTRDLPRQAKTKGQRVNGRGSTVAQVVPRASADPDTDDVPPRVKLVVASVATACVVALIAVAILSPKMFQSVFTKEQSLWERLPAPSALPSMSAGAPQEMPSGGLAPVLPALPGATLGPSAGPSAPGAERGAQSPSETPKVNSETPTRPGASTQAKPGNPEAKAGSPEAKAGNPEAKAVPSPERPNAKSEKPNSPSEVGSTPSAASPNDKAAESESGGKNETASSNVAGPPPPKAQE